MSAAESLDLFSLDALLSEEDLLVRDSVARFVDVEIQPKVGAWFAEQHFPVELIPSMANLGLLGATIEGYGCAGASKLAYGLICQELERGDSSFRSFVSVQSSLVMGCIADFGSEAQCERWLPVMASGACVGCFGLTEAQGGSDPANMQTRAEQRGGDWVITGSKHWITNGGIADLAIVWAQTSTGISAFLIPRDAPGFEQHEIKNKLSLRASATGEIYLDSVRVPHDHHLVGARGLKAALACLNNARYGIAWGAVGAASACLQEAIEYVKDRTLFGEPLARKQLIQARLADSARRLTTAQLLAFRLAQLHDAGTASATQISMAKWNNVRMALRVARDCRDMLGAAGITTEHSAMRHMLNLESVNTYEGTESIHALVVGRALTGEAAF